MYNRLGIWQSVHPSTHSPSAEDWESIRTGEHSVLTPAESQETSTYLSIPIDTIPTDLPLPCALYVRITEKFILFRKKQDVLTATRAQTLATASNGLIYVSLKEWNAFLHSLQTVLAAGHHLLSADPVLSQGLGIRNLLLAYVRDLDVQPDFQPQLFEKIRLLAEDLASLIHRHPEVSNKLLKRYQEPSLYYINHVVNVAIYSIAVALKQKFPLETLKVLACATLLHNVGNRMVPAELLYKPTELTLDEKMAVDSHILHGASLLQNLGASKEIVLTAMQHHDRYDGQQSGHTRTSGDDIHPFARICSIADVFDALTSPRPYYAHPLEPLAAVTRMREMKGKFDPRILPMVTDEKQ